MPRPPQGGQVLPYISHRGICHPKGQGFAPLWSENGCRICSFGIWNRVHVWFQGNYGSVRTYFLFQFQMGRKKEKYANSSFVAVLIKVMMTQFLKARSENGCGFQRPSLKTGVKSDIFWSKIGSGFGEPGGTPSPRIPQRTPRGPRPGYQDTSNLLPYSKITSASSHKDVSMVTSECGIRSRARTGHKQALSAKKAKHLGSVGA